MFSLCLSISFNTANLCFNFGVRDRILNVFSLPSVYHRNMALVFALSIYPHSFQSSLVCLTRWIPYPALGVMNVCIIRIIVGLLMASWSIPFFPRLLTSPTAFFTCDVPVWLFALPGSRDPYMLSFVCRTQLIPHQFPFLLTPAFRLIEHGAL